MTEAFHLWTDSAQARRFLAEEVRIDSWVGGRYEALFDPQDDPAVALTGTYGSKVVALEPPRRLVFQWHSLTPRSAAQAVAGERRLQESMVEVRFEPIGGSVQRTRVTIRHYRFGDDTHWAAAYRFYRDRGWPWILRRLVALFPEGHAHWRAVEVEEGDAPAGGPGPMGPRGAR